jgi:hypothetical protein
MLPAIFIAETSSPILRFRVDFSGRSGLLKDWVRTSGRSNTLPGLFQRGDDRWNTHFLGKVQIQNAKEVIWEIVSVDRHGTGIIQRSKAGSQRPGS